MPKPDRKPDPDVEPDYDRADPEFEEAPLASYDEGADVDYEVPADPDYDDPGQADDALEVADPEYDEVMQGPEPVEPAPVLALVAASVFAFEVGWPVLPRAQQQPFPIVWRGHLRERHPTTGLLHRVPVYRLADGYWDCYHEEELQVA